MENCTLQFLPKTLLYITDGEGVVIVVSCMLQAIGDVGTTLEGNNQLVRNHDAPPHARGDIERSTVTSLSCACFTHTDLPDIAVCRAVSE